MRAFGLKWFGFAFLFLFCAEALAVSDSKKKLNPEVQTYSFRPLLIQGRKRLVKKAKDMEVKTDNILETQIFFLKTDFKKRIFSDEGLEQ